MPVTDKERWTDPRLKALPKYVHGEFMNLHRRDMLLVKKIDELRELRNKEIDIDLFVSENSEDKYLNKWMDRQIAKGELISSGRDIYSIAWQSCWPEESPNMIFQYLHEKLNVRFKWWGRAGWLGSDGLMILKDQLRTVNHALPNINACVYSCPGDYGEKLSFGSKILKLNEFYNYISSPNLRENRMITGNYARMASNIQFCNIEVKRGTEVETTTLAALWIELLEEIKEEEEEIACSRLKNKQCDQCENTGHDIPKQFILPNGDPALTIARKLYSQCQGQYPLMQRMLYQFSLEELSLILRNEPAISRCSICIFNSCIQKAKDTYEFIKPLFDAEFQKKIDQNQEWDIEPLQF